MSQAHESEMAASLVVPADANFLQAKLEIQVNSLSQSSLVTGQISINKVRMNDHKTCASNQPRSGKRWNDSFQPRLHLRVLGVYVRTAGPYIALRMPSTTNHRS